MNANLVVSNGELMKSVPEDLIRPTFAE